MFYFNGRSWSRLSGEKKYPAEEKTKDAGKETGLTRVGRSLKDEKGQDQSTGEGICSW